MATRSATSGDRPQAPPDHFVDETAQHHDPPCGAAGAAAVAGRWCRRRRDVRGAGDRCLDQLGDSACRAAKDRPSIVTSRPSIFRSPDSHCDRAALRAALRTLDEVEVLAGVGERERQRREPAGAACVAPGVRPLRPAPGAGRLQGREAQVAARARWPASAAGAGASRSRREPARRRRGAAARASMPRVLLARRLVAGELRSWRRLRRCSWAATFVLTSALSARFGEIASTHRAASSTAPASTVPRIIRCMRGSRARSFRGSCAGGGGLVGRRRSPRPGAWSARAARRRPRALAGRAVCGAPSAASCGALLEVGHEREARRLVAADAVAGGRVSPSFAGSPRSVRLEADLVDAGHRVEAVHVLRNVALALAAAGAARGPGPGRAPRSEPVPPPPPSTVAVGGERALGRRQPDVAGGDAARAR